MKQIRGKSLVGTAFDVVHSSIHYSGFLLLVIAFTDVYVRYERVAETQQQLNDELAKFDEIQREEIGERHRRAVKDDNVVVAGIEKKFAQLELRYNQFHEIKIGGGHGWRVEKKDTPITALEMVPMTCQRTCSRLVLEEVS